jgi:hypothetical protein
MKIRDLPTGLLARVQRSGRTFFYFRAHPAEKEVPLGCDRDVALGRYQLMQRSRLIEACPGGLRAIDLVLQYQRCNAPPLERHGRSRRREEVNVLVDFFSERGNPYITSIPPQKQFESWVTEKDNIKNLDSIRLFRMMWSFFTKHGYIEIECPWKTTGQHRERVTLELAEILHPYSTPPLRDVLDAMLTFGVVSSVTELAAFSASRAMIQKALHASKRAARDALEENFRSDLVPALLDLTCEDLFDILSSSNGIKNLAPGKIDLKGGKRTAVRRLRNKVATMRHSAIDLSGEVKA